MQSLREQLPQALHARITCLPPTNFSMHFRITSSLFSCSLASGEVRGVTAVVHECAPDTPKARASAVARHGTGAIGEFLSKTVVGQKVDISLGAFLESVRH